MTRYTKHDCEESAKRFADTIHRQYGDCWKKGKDGKNISTIGCLQVDYNPIYGGCVLTEIHNKRGGITHPLGSSRSKPYEFTKMLDTVNIALKDYCKGIKKKR